ncbi:D-Ala-D-Ala carboxypeptidase family metallohydrolase [Moraxella bovoculi]|uniref:Peptidase M15A n=1 Tax=Moraxella bovoculi 237 TaxID=743974 RepID=A0A066UJH3_9GAMM|nr:D-Ala-D-Ala carboxypeptidase family metallohydrolase [Moraxella bovoculi]AKG15423.2 hypothetical protein AAX08_05210 [Moraxella bovoculi]KDN26032.1 peptidase M15A [Moraxella bovoculi 237]
MIGQVDKMMTMNKKLQVTAVIMMGVFGLSSCAQKTAPAKKPQPTKVLSKPKQSTKQPVNTVNTVAKPPQINIIHHHGDHDGHAHDIIRNVGTKADFEMWLRSHPHQKSHVEEYTQFLKNHIGKNLPPMHQLLTTARSWQECGYEPYEVPPRELWAQMLPTIKLYDELRAKGILPANTHIRSVYRNPDLNRCAGGAPSSKHMTNGAMDIWVPTYDADSHELYQLQNRLCEYWVFYGESHNFGLGLYGTGAIHLDTQGYRKWGSQFSESHSMCRYTPPKPSEFTWQ